MYPASFEYHAPTTLAEAKDLYAAAKKARGNSSTPSSNLDIPANQTCCCTHWRPSKKCSVGLEPTHETFPEPSISISSISANW